MSKKAKGAGAQPALQKPNMKHYLDGRVVLVTGGGSGLGQGISFACADAGARVVILSPGESGGVTEAAIRERGGHAIWVQGDVSRMEDFAEAAERSIAVFGKLDAVVHNAISRGGGTLAEVQDIDEDLWRGGVAVSLRGAYNLAVAARPHLKPGRGRFVLFTSPAGMEGSVRMPAYAAVKGALRGFAKSLAVEWGPLGISVTVVSPLALSDALKQAFEVDPGLKARMDKVVPLGRVGDPTTDVAPVVAFLVGDGARYINGQTIIVDGGRYTTL